jgi:hypothetical protein
LWRRHHHTACDIRILFRVASNSCYQFKIQSVFGRVKIAGDGTIIVLVPHADILWAMLTNRQHFVSRAAINA